MKIHVTLFTMRDCGIAERESVVPSNQHSPPFAFSAPSARSSRLTTSSSLLILTHRCPVNPILSLRLLSPSGKVVVSVDVVSRHVASNANFPDLHQPLRSCHQKAEKAASPKLAKLLRQSPKFSRPAARKLAFRSVAFSLFVALRRCVDRH